MNFNIHTVDHYIVHIRHAGTYTVQYADIYSNKFLQYLNRSFIFEEF
jgi:hypothetical protein